jgi:hypothetical protein
VDELDRLLELYRTRPSAPALWKLDVLMDLEPLRDARILRFLLQVLLDSREPSKVRIAVVWHLRVSVRACGSRNCVAEAFVRLLEDRASPELRLAAALALSDFVDVGNLCSVLGPLARDTAEPLDFRYCVFSSVERAGPSDEAVVLMRHLSTDPVLGSAAHAVLSRWKHG